MGTTQLLAQGFPDHRAATAAVASLIEPTRTDDPINPLSSPLADHPLTNV